MIRREYAKYCRVFCTSFCGGSWLFGFFCLFRYRYLSVCEC
nr:MAG TPA: hypothetical protein [Inoviridae sp.]